MSLSRIATGVMKKVMTRSTNLPSTTSKPCACSTALQQTVQQALHEEFSMMKTAMAKQSQPISGVARFGGIFLVGVTVMYTPQPEGSPARVLVIAAEHYIKHMSRKSGKVEQE